MELLFPFYLLVTTGYLVQTSGYLVFTFGYLITTAGYFCLLLVTSGYFSLLVVSLFSNNELYHIVDLNLLTSDSPVLVDAVCL